MISQWIKPTRKENAKEDTIYPKNWLKTILGITNPIKNSPGNSNDLIATCGTIMVSKYKSIALIIKENAPNVKRFNGKVTTCNIGFKKIDIIDKIKPLTKRIPNPPVMVNPLNNDGSTDKARLFIATFLAKDFIKLVPTMLTYPTLQCQF